MKLKNLLEIFYFDGYFVNYSDKHLLLPPIYSHPDLLKKAENIEGEYHVEIVDTVFMQLRVAICSDDYCAENAILFIESEKSYERRSQNCCDTCGKDFSGSIFEFGYAYYFNTKTLNSWYPLKNERLQIDPGRCMGGGYICTGCANDEVELLNRIKQLT